ncbi:MAG: S1 family peptidase, partial [Pirellulales bacterium]|nr:S1 family peptidase [Pirellulales bacterium]
GLTGAYMPAGQKRAGQNMVDNFYPTAESTPNIILMDFDQPGDPYESSFGSTLPLDLEYLCAPGDSGGGLFADLGFGEELIGVHSFGWGLLDGDPNADYGDASGDTRVSVFNSWIDGAMDGQIVNPGKGGGKKNSRSNFVQGDYEFGYVGNVIPEPSTFVLLTMAALGMLTYMWNRRRS